MRTRLRFRIVSAVAIATVLIVVGVGLARVFGPAGTGGPPSGNPSGAIPFSEVLAPKGTVYPVASGQLNWELSVNLTGTPYANWTISGEFFEPAAAVTLFLVNSSEHAAWIASGGTQFNVVFWCMGTLNQSFLAETVVPTDTYYVVLEDLGAANTTVSLTTNLVAQGVES